MGAPVRQQDRSRLTQRRLLDATVECLIEVGWAATTTTLVADRAGVSRGAQLHHYPTKATLVLAAVEHLIQRRGEELEAEAATLPALPPAEAGRPRRRPARRDFHRAFVRSGARAVGGCPHRSGASGGLGPGRGAIWPGRAPARGHACSAPTSRGRACARRCRPLSICSAGWAWPTCSPTTPQRRDALLAEWKQQLVRYLVD